MVVGPEIQTEINWIDEYKKSNLAKSSTKNFMEYLDGLARGTEQRIAARLQGFYDEHQHRNGSPVKKFKQASKIFLNAITMGKPQRPSKKL